LDCPVCRVSLIVLERHQVEVDYCGLCHGLWLDEEEMALMAEALSHPVSLPDFRQIPPIAHPPQKSHRCPRCRARMRRIPMGVQADDASVVIDHCPRNHGLWFDTGELEQVLARYRHQAVASQDLLSSLGEVLSRS
jgi:Zn-finger nucleic acid-binding protein